jgi:hypothetical protein
MTRLINNPKLPSIIEQMKQMDISTYDLFKIIMELDEGKQILSMLLDEYPNHEELN